MTAAQRREQLIAVTRVLFAEKGVEGTTVEEIAANAHVSKPVVYEHFGGKEGLYAVIVDREQRTLQESIRAAIDQAKGARRKVEAGTLALLDYIESNPDGFRIISRDAPAGSTGTSFATILSDVASQVEDILADEFRRRGLRAEMAPMYAQMLVGMIAYTGQWWLDERDPDKATVAANILNLAWNGLARMVPVPGLYTPVD
ncbi:TetR/AcrR family transcriptional regulator [Raineyella fluvialis]|uniref:TetR family transcriptional regulator n=1 Tax=Raineyella fluvialis TaxID=2662261 RepID=A0A5Q2FG16_9ACTN|nr:TetR/AcrR family transcriptional regulator [Raineyella fluvialis]QGF24063.1 TetR family transcriptional regulator [Raineyella fluvialis]